MSALSSIVVSGIGVTASAGQNKEAFLAGLLSGENLFGIMQREGRQAPETPPSEDETPLQEKYLGAEISKLSVPDSIPKSLLRTASWSSQVTVSTLHEAWNDSRLDEVASERIGLVIGGSNVQQRELVNVHDKYRDKPQFLRPTYAMSFMDSDAVGVCTEVFPIRGPSYTLGGASASGQVAVIQAINAVRSGQVDVCIAIGSMMDLSYWECRGFRTLGAMGSEKFAFSPELACRPFDLDHDGFIFGEACGVIVIETKEHARKRGADIYAEIKGWSHIMDGNRNPNPSLEGEKTVVTNSLRMANMTASDIHYVNPHGTASIVGDETELSVLKQSGLEHAYINATKSIIGHGLSAAGTVELIATILQMKAGRIHRTRNLTTPIDMDFNWVREKSIQQTISTAISLSMGFGGVNTAVCIEQC
ncbi:beta-ketoacyl synthase N-terminal-like domain-containing protein [Teredinibacter haidensis]|uniref:beta-ketoacyl synthase N-terminal-like domain-containing protein n=1 Tax=Teredinibacter haidensis TaxID=2731755 RepID=UPI000948AF99|nr:beta-ketoacyl synthase N-terminal-like domain-containing protein [Teredinibacter haidensis]